MNQLPVASLTSVSSSRLNMGLKMGALNLLRGFSVARALFQQPTNVKATQPEGPPRGSVGSAASSGASGSSGSSSATSRKPRMGIAKFTMASWWDMDG